MGTPAAPRLDLRLRGRIERSPRRATAAEVTRAVGDLAWQLGLPRPSYQQVRVLLGRARGQSRPRSAGQSSRGRVVLHYAGRALDFVYQYPGPGLADVYRRYKRGAWP